MTGLRGRWFVSGVVALAAGSGAVAGAAGAERSLANGCPHPTVPVPRHEPLYAPGSTELVSGLYQQGGAVPQPPCHPEPRGPHAGQLTVTNRTGTFTATQTVKAGKLAHIPLRPGTYQLSGEMSGGGRTVSVEVRVKAGKRVRQDAFQDVP